MYQTCRPSLFGAVTERIMSCSHSQCVEVDQSRTRPSTSPAESPIFLVGSERSGTTLLRLMLDHHPQISFLSEFEFSVLHIGNDGRWPPIETYHEFLRHDRVFGLTDLQIDTQLPLPQLLSSFLDQKRCRDGKLCVGATVHHYFERLRYVWPDARYIYLLRDGRDVSRSIIQMGWAGNMWTAADRWIMAEQSWQQLGADVDASQRIETRYEALMAEPEAQLTRLCDFIGVTFDRAMFDYAADSSYGLPDERFCEQWRRKLPDRQIRLAEARIGPMLAQRGYPLSGLGPLTVSAAMERKLRKQDRWYRARNRMRRFGLTLFAAEWFARRMGLHRLRAHCQARMDRITNARLR